MECDFFVGQKVVCIDDRYLMRPHNEKLPVKGEIYTIRWIGIDSQYGVGPVVRLIEIVNPEHQYYPPSRMLPPEECWFQARRFRPLVDTKDNESMKQLKTILADPYNPVGGFEEPKRKVKEGASS